MRQVPKETLLSIQDHFHNVMRERAENLIVEHKVVLPELAAIDPQRDRLHAYAPRGRRHALDVALCRVADKHQCHVQVARLHDATATLAMHRISKSGQAPASWLVRPQCEEHALNEFSHGANGPYRDSQASPPNQACRRASADIPGSAMQTTPHHGD